MGTHAYQDIKFSAGSLALIRTMNTIVDEYVAAGYRLTVRQLYYQLVARDVVENTERSYKRITGIVNDAKLGGYMDWEAIEDRTRAFIRRARWDSAQDLLTACAKQFHMDMWAGQPERVFVIVEKEALAGVLERACRAFDVPLLAARGYPSGTVLREFAVEDIFHAIDGDQEVTILHLGDHDPSGIDMSRDLRERIALFAETPRVNLERIALNMPQIESQKPPPNPAKTVDPRFQSYQAEFGDESWELDALKPDYLDKLVRRKIKEHIEGDKWAARESEIEDIRAKLEEVAEEFEA